MIALEVISLLNQIHPAVTLRWSNAFDIAVPFEYWLMVNGTKLSGTPDIFNIMMAILPEDSVNSLNSSDHSYSVVELTFYSRYEFILVAKYNLTGVTIQSDPVEVNHVTEQGGMYVCTYVRVNFL